MRSEPTRRVQFLQMIKRLPISTVAAAIFLLTGCATRYAEPDKNVPSATITVVHQGTDFPSWTTVSVFDNSECKATPKSGRIGSVGKAYDLSETPKSVKIRAQERTTLSVQGTIRSAVSVSGMTSSWTWYTCTNLVSFSAEPGKTYTVTQRVYASNRCASVVTDDSTQGPVADFVQHPTPAACELKGI